MNLADFLSSVDLGDIFAKGGIVIFCLMTLIQIVPIKVNPWSWIARKIGRAINHEVIVKVDKLERDVERMQSCEDEREANACRTRILRFGDELLHGTKHSKEHFDQVLLDITYYEQYCANHKDYSNNVAILTIEQIKKTYSKCMRERTFL